MTTKSNGEQRIALRNAGKINPCDIREYINAGGYEGLRRALEIPPEKVIEIITASGLRGRGGAGFPTGTKWNFVRAAGGAEKYAVCNADEGEPGTFKDRILMEQDPHGYIEGLVIAAYAAGAQKGYIYIRGEYYPAIETARKALKDAEKLGFLGEHILDSGFSLQLDIKLGGGSYLCGEESALIESLEGKRGFPRIKPPYPAEKGVFGKPTLVNNVETLAHVPPIMVNGTEWYKSMGTTATPGTKIFTLCGDVASPGAYETGMGVPLKTLINDFGGGVTGGKKILAVLSGGAAGTYIPSKMLDIHMDFDSLKEKNLLLGSGAVMVLNESRSLGDNLENILHFFHHESCGKCVPCRVGCEHLLHMSHRRGGSGPREREQCLDRMLELSTMMAKTSLCPLGQSPVFPIRSIAQYHKKIF